MPFENFSPAISLDLPANTHVCDKLKLANSMSPTGLLVEFYLKWDNLGYFMTETLENIVLKIDRIVKVLLCNADSIVC